MLARAEPPQLAECTVAGVLIRFCGHAPPSLALPRLARFASGPATTHIHVGEVPAAPPGARALMDRRDISVFVLGDGEYRFRVDERSSVRAPAYEAGADIAIRVSLAHHLSTRGGLLLHASGWKRGDEVAVFFGVSGAGKTTTVSQAPLEAYLCDETIAIRRTDEGCVAFGTPFSGADPRLMQPGSGRLRGAYAIEKSPEPGPVAPLATTDAMARVMRCVMLHGGGARELSGVMDTAAWMVERGLVHAIRLALGQDPWAAIDAHGKGA